MWLLSGVYMYTYVYICPWRTASIRIHNKPLVKQFSLVLFLILFVLGHIWWYSRLSPVLCKRITFGIVQGIINMGFYGVLMIKLRLAPCKASPPPPPLYLSGRVFLFFILFYLLVFSETNICSYMFEFNLILWCWEPYISHLGCDFNSRTHI